MTAYRFVDRHGWEKWLELPDRPPPVWCVPTPIEMPQSFKASPVLSMRVESRLFEGQTWRLPGWSDERVYSEGGRQLSDADRFDVNRPSLHREHRYVEALLRIQRIIEDERSDGGAFGPLGEALVAMGTVRRLESEIRRMSWLHKSDPR